ncbi:MAG: ATPase, T2SS/T4P/T4SS family [Actinomycetota bacterium]
MRAAVSDQCLDTEVIDDSIDAVCAAVAHSDGELHALVADAVRRIAALADPRTQEAIERAALARLAGLAELQPLLDDRSVDEVLVTGRRIWVEREGRLRPAGDLRSTSVEHLIERVLAPIGRRIDTLSPIVDARLPDGSRVCAVIPPVAIGGASLSIRRFAQRVRPLSDFAEPAVEEICRHVVDHRCNVLVSGATSSGKTSLLASLLGLVDPTARLIVIEDTAELPCGADHLVRLEARPADAEGVPAIDLDRLVRTALRLRPDRLVVGEVRGDEVLALVQAMNTGHDGSFSTCHANGPLDALLRIESLVLQAAPRWPLAAIRRQIVRSIDVVVHVERDATTGRRRISSVHEVELEAPVDESRPPTLRRLDGAHGGAARPEPSRRRT